MTTCATRETIQLKENAPAPLGAYSHAVKAGDFIFLCGMGARDPLSGKEVGVTLDEQGQVVSYDVAVQTQAVIENMKTVLQACQASLEDVVDVQVFLADMKDFEAFNTVYARYFDVPNPPARTTIEARPPGLNFVEIKAVALRPPSSN